MLVEVEQSQITDSLDKIAEAIDGCAWGCMNYDLADRWAQDGLNRIADANREGFAEIASAIRDGFAEIASALKDRTKL